MPQLQGRHLRGGEKLRRTPRLKEKSSEKGGNALRMWFGLEKSKTRGKKVGPAWRGGGVGRTCQDFT